MSTDSTQVRTIDSPAYLHGVSESDIPTSRFAVALPKAVAASIFSSTGSSLTSLPGRILVSSLSGLGWITLGTVQRVMSAARFVFSGVKTERAVQEVAMSVELVGQRELEAKERLRDILAGGINSAASFIPGGSLIHGSVALATGADAIAKKTQKWGLFGLRTLVTNFYGYAKYIIGGEWFRWSERKVEHIKSSCYRNMVQPSGFGEDLLLWSDIQHSTALKLLRPPKLRPPISPCTDDELSRFLHLPAGAKRIILERIVASKTWGFTEDEASAFSLVLERWIDNEIHLQTQSDNDKKVLANLYSIYLAITPVFFAPKISSYEYENFKRLHIDDQRDRLFLLAYHSNDASIIPQYVQTMQKNDIDRSEVEKESLFSLLGLFSPSVESLKAELITPTEFTTLPRHVQYRIFKLVGKECSLPPEIQSLFIEKAPNLSSWQATSRDDKELLSHTALFYYNQLPREQQKSVYNLSFDEIRRLPKENLTTFLVEVLQKIPPPTMTEEMGIICGGVINPDIASDKINDLKILKKAFEEGVQKLIDDAKFLKNFIRVVNRRLPLEKKILLRDALDAPLALYFFTEDELIAAIEKSRKESRSMALSEDIRETARKTLLVLEKALEWHTADELEQAENDSSLALKEGEPLPPKSANLPETPLEAIDQSIGSHVISSGGWYRTFDVVGSVLENIVSLSGQAVAQVPRGIGLALDTTAGSTAVYGTIRTLALGLQVCSQFQLLMDRLAQSLKLTVSGKEYNWIEHVERPAAAIPLIPLRLTIPLQNTLLGGMEAVKVRIDSLNETIASLRASRQKLELTGSSTELDEKIEKTEHEITGTSSKIKELAASDKTLSPLAGVAEQELQLIFSSSKTAQDAILRIREAAIPPGTRAVLSIINPSHLNPSWSGTQPILNSLPPVEPSLSKKAITLQTFSVLSPKVHTYGGTRTDEGPARPILSARPARASKTQTTHQSPRVTQVTAPPLGSHPILEGMIQDRYQKAALLAPLYQDLQTAISAQKALEEASSFQKFFAEYGSPFISSLYTTSISPAMASALALWRQEVACATKVIHTVASVEEFQTQAAYGIFAGVNQAGVIAQDTTAQAMHWLSKHIGDLFVAQQGEAEKSAARQKFDSVLGYVAGFGSRSLVTMMLGRALGYYSPVILLPFLLSRTIPDLLNASAEPVARNLGKKVFLNGYRGMAWISRTGGFYTHQGMTALGKFVQRAINRGQGYVDPERVQAFLSLKKAEQKYVVELIRESTQVDDDAKNEVKELAEGYFQEPSSLDPMSKHAFVEALLLAYDHLQPQDFLKITPSYFNQLDKRVQKRVTQAVKRKYPTIPFQNTEEIIEKFNTLTAKERKSINWVTQEEFSKLSKESQKELCFQVLHSEAYKNWYERGGADLTFEELFDHIDPEEPSISGKDLRIILSLYQDVADGELADISPVKLASSNISRLLRLYEVLETAQSYQSQQGLLLAIANKADVEMESIPSLLKMENALDPGVQKKRERLLAAMASAYRSLPEFYRRGFFDISCKEVTFMSREEKKIALEYIIQKNPDKKASLKSLIADVDLKEDENSKIFIELFNSLDKVDKTAFHQTAAHHHKVFSFLTRSLLEEVKEVDARLQRASLEKKDAEQRIIDYAALLDALKQTGEAPEDKKRIEAITNQMRQSTALKSMRERELLYLLSTRSEIEKLLLEEHITIAPCTIEHKMKPHPLAQAVCELMVKAMRDEMLSTTSLQQLEEKYTSTNKDLSSMVEKLGQDQYLDPQGREFLCALKDALAPLRAAYEEKKSLLHGSFVTLPPHLEIIVRGTKERFSQITDLPSLQKSYEEALSFAKEMATVIPEISPSQIDIACNGIDSAYESRIKDLSPKDPAISQSKWGIVRSLLPFMRVQTSD